MPFSKNNYRFVEEPKIITRYDDKNTLELNKISWFGHEPTYDLRNWSGNHDSMSKGLSSLSLEDLKNLKAVLNDMDI